MPHQQAYFHPNPATGAPPSHSNTPTQGISQSLHPPVQHPHPHPHSNHSIPQLPSSLNNNRQHLLNPLPSTQQFTLPLPLSADGSNHQHQHQNQHQHQHQHQSLQPQHHQNLHSYQQQHLTRPLSPQLQRQQFHNESEEQQQNQQVHPVAPGHEPPQEQQASNHSQSNTLTLPLPTSLHRPYSMLENHTALRYNQSQLPPVNSAAKTSHIPHTFPHSLPILQGHIQQNAQCNQNESERQNDQQTEQHAAKNIIESHVLRQQPTLATTQQQDVSSPTIQVHSTQDFIAEQQHRRNHQNQNQNHQNQNQTQQQEQNLESHAAAQVPSLFRNEAMENVHSKIAHSSSIPQLSHPTLTHQVPSPTHNENALVFHRQHYNQNHPQNYHEVQQQNQFQGGAVHNERLHSQQMQKMGTSVQPDRIAVTHQGSSNRNSEVRSEQQMSQQSEQPPNQSERQQEQPEQQQEQHKQQQKHQLQQQQQQQQQQHQLMESEEQRHRHRQQQHGLDMQQEHIQSQRQSQEPERSHQQQHHHQQHQQLQQHQYQHQHQHQHQQNPQQHQDPEQTPHYRHHQQSQPSTSSPQQPHQQIGPPDLHDNEREKQSAHQERPRPIGQNSSREQQENLENRNQSNVSQEKEDIQQSPRRQQPSRKITRYPCSLSLDDVNVITRRCGDIFWLLRNNTIATQWFFQWILNPNVSHDDATRVNISRSKGFRTMQSCSTAGCASFEPHSLLQKSATLLLPFNVHDSVEIGYFIESSSSNQQNRNGNNNNNNNNNSSPMSSTSSAIQSQNMMRIGKYVYCSSQRQLLRVSKVRGPDQASHLSNVIINKTAMLISTNNQAMYVNDYIMASLPWASDNSSISITRIPESFTLHSRTMTFQKLTQVLPRSGIGISMPADCINNDMLPPSEPADDMGLLNDSFFGIGTFGLYDATLVPTETRMEERDEDEGGEDSGSDRILGDTTTSSGNINKRIKSRALDLSIGQWAVPEHCKVCKSYQVLHLALMRHEAKTLRVQFMHAFSIRIGNVNNSSGARSLRPVSAPAVGFASGGAGGALFSDRDADVARPQSQQPSTLPISGNINTSANSITRRDKNVIEHQTQGNSGVDELNITFPGYGIKGHAVYSAPMLGVTGMNGGLGGVIESNQTDIQKDITTDSSEIVGTNIQKIHMTQQQQPQHQQTLGHIQQSHHHSTETAIPPFQTGPTNVDDVLRGVPTTTVDPIELTVSTAPEMTHIRPAPVTASAPAPAPVPSPFSFPGMGAAFHDTGSSARQIASSVMEAAGAGVDNNNNSHTKTAPEIADNLQISTTNTVQNESGGYTLRRRKVSTVKKIVTDSAEMKKEKLSGDESSAGGGGGSGSGGKIVKKSLAAPTKGEIIIRNRISAQRSNEKRRRKLEASKTELGYLKKTYLPHLQHKQGTLISENERLKLQFMEKYQRNDIQSFF